MPPLRGGGPGAHRARRHASPNVRSVLEGTEARRQEGTKARSVGGPPFTPKACSSVAGGQLAAARRPPDRACEFVSDPEGVVAIAGTVGVSCATLTLSGSGILRAANPGVSPAKGGFHSRLLTYRPSAWGRDTSPYLRVGLVSLHFSIKASLLGAGSCTGHAFPCSPWDAPGSRLDHARAIRRGRWSETSWRPRAPTRSR